MKSQRLMPGFVAALLTMGCAASQYHPRSAGGLLLYPMGDGGGIDVYRAGALVAGSGTYGGLSQAAGCSVEARQHADSAGSNALGARVATWGGLALLAGGVAVPVVGLATGDATRADHAGPYVGAMLGLLTAGLVGIVTGDWLDGQATGHALDAVAFHNDAVGPEGSCLAGPRPPALAWVPTPSTASVPSLESPAVERGTEASFLAAEPGAPVARDEGRHARRPSRRRPRR